jgi:hypothetical protein
MQRCMIQFYRIEIYYNVASMWTLEVHVTGIRLRWTMRWDINLADTDEARL